MSGELPVRPPSFDDSNLVVIGRKVAEARALDMDELERQGIDWVDFGRACKVQMSRLRELPEVAPYLHPPVPTAGEPGPVGASPSAGDGSAHVQALSVQPRDPAPYIHIVLEPWGEDSLVYRALYKAFWPIVAMLLIVLGMTVGIAADLVVVLLGGAATVSVVLAREETA